MLGIAYESVSKLDRVPTHKNGGEEVEDAISCRYKKYHLEESRLPGLRKHAKEEKTERYFEESRCQDIEDLT